VKYPQDFATPGAVSVLTATAGNPAFDYHSAGQFSVYFQDDWRINPRLTLNLGRRNVASRIGFAYDQGGSAKNVIRDGYSLYYAQVFQDIPLFAQQHTNPTIFATVINLLGNSTSPQTNTDSFLRNFRYGIDPVNVTCSLLTSRMARWGLLWTWIP
jgi:hypothetical protein